MWLVMFVHNINQYLHAMITFVKDMHIHTLFSMFGLRWSLILAMHGFKYEIWKEPQTNHNSCWRIEYHIESSKLINPLSPGDAQTHQWSYQYWTRWGRFVWRNQIIIWMGAIFVGMFIRNTSKYMFCGEAMNISHIIYLRVLNHIERCLMC